MLTLFELFGAVFFSFGVGTPFPTPLFQHYTAGNSIASFQLWGAIALCTKLLPVFVSV